MSIYDIRPYESAGPLVLGMRPEEVHTILGKPRNSSKSRRGERSDTYPQLTATYDKDSERLIELGIGVQVDVRFRGIQLFTDPTALDFLVAADGAPLEAVGFILFPSLGIVLGDFDSDQENERVVSIFGRGRWDDVSDMTPYRRS